IAVRSVTTELEIKDGELIAIGGLLRTEETAGRKRVPGLGSIPGIGGLFRANANEVIKTQLMIFLTIHILQESEPNHVTIPASAATPHAEVEEEAGWLEYDNAQGHFWGRLRSEEQRNAEAQPLRPRWVLPEPEPVEEGRAEAADAALAEMLPDNTEAPAPPRTAPPEKMGIESATP
ncbi:MAG: hypothetical protein V1918_00300, partial [Planctomycetota bacterium]